METTTDTHETPALSPWQRRQGARLDRIKDKIETLPPMVRRAIEYGPYYECRSLVDALTEPPQAGSSHGMTARMVAELAIELARIEVAPADGDNHG